MKLQTMSFAASREHKPAHPERTATRSGSGANLDVTFGEWTNRAALARSIRMQEKRERRSGDWRACVRLSDGEGY